MFVHPAGLLAFFTCCLDALDSKSRIQPIGICETGRQMIVKAVLSAT